LFELQIPAPVDGDDLQTVSALADHLAVKLENLELSSSLGRAGRELASVKSFLENLVESLPVGIVGLVGPELRVRLWNPAEARRTGISKERALGKRYLQDIAPSHIGPAVADAIRRGTREVLSFPNVSWSPSAKDTSVDVTVAPLQSDGRKEPAGYVLIIVDTTARSALEREVEEFRRLAALGQFATALAHDIRTPLSSIRMNVQILRDKVDLPADDMEYFDLTLEAISRLAREVEELLDFTKPAVLRIDDVELGTLFDDVVDATRAHAAEGRVRVVVDVPESLRAPIDEMRVRQMLVNLVDNAIRASRSDTMVYLSAREEGHDYVVVTVEDSGSGIEPEHLERIWEPFFTTKPDGTGLGLAIVRKIVMAHAGSIRVESNGQGTRFDVRFPATRAMEVVVPIEECRRTAPVRGTGGAESVLKVGVSPE
jgi:PAS domain S-box-containing protein